MKEKFLIVGAGAREGVFALNLMKDTTLFAVISHANPTIVDCVEKSGGKYLVANASDAEIVSEFALRHQVDYAFVSADDPLSKGVVDALLAKDIRAVGGTKAATRIEWDKVYSIDLVKRVCPEYVPFYKVVSDGDDISKCIDEFKNKGLEVVVKPQGLTGGKGVKVMPEHLPDYSDAITYTSELLEAKSSEKVLLVEKLNGIEFTIMGLTDGKTVVLSPASYDYPFRLEDDKGPGTGGMGCFTANEKKLPFMTDEDLRDCKHIMQTVVNEMTGNNLLFNGVINGGFFKTKEGIKFMEFNGRFGDPEALNVLTVLKTPFSKLLKDIWHKRLKEETVEFLAKASVVKYLVAEEYPMSSAEVIDFRVDVNSIEKMGVDIFYASCVQTGANQYQTLKKSRVVALGAVADKIEQASDVVNEAISYVKGDLHYRRDIGSKKSLEKLLSVL